MPRCTRRRLVSFLVSHIVVLLLAAMPVAAAAGPQDLANRIAQEVMSPFCPGVTLHDCPSKQAVELRAQIETWAGQGWSRERIFEELEAEYGPSIRAAPEPTGAGLLAWVLPGVGVAAGALAAWWAARRWAAQGRPPRASAGARAAASPEERQRLDAELRALREQT